MLEAINELSTSVETDESADILVETVRNGDDRLKGEFVLSFNDGRTTETTRPLQSFISAEDLKMELEAFSNVGRVNVVRAQSLIGYQWNIEFASCSLKNGIEVCNDGDLLDLVASSITLQGWGGPELAVEPSTIAILQIRLVLVLAISVTFKSSMFENLILHNGMQGLE